MSINQTDVIDFISTKPNGKGILTISDHQFWDELWHLHLLQDKINAYLKFIESGQIFTEYPTAVGREISIDMVMKFEPTVEASSFLEKAKEIVTKAGVGFEWRVFHSEK